MELSGPEYVEEFKRAVRQALRDERAARSAQQDTHAKRLVELGAEIEHMVAAVAPGLLSPTLKARLEAAEVERTALMSTSCASGSSAVADLVPRLADTYRTLVEHLERVPPR